MLFRVAKRHGFVQSRSVRMMKAAESTEVARFVSMKIHTTTARSVNIFCNISSLFRSRFLPVGGRIHSEYGRCCRA